MPCFQIFRKFKENNKSANLKGHGLMFHRLRVNETKFDECNFTKIAV